MAKLNPEVDQFLLELMHKDFSKHPELRSRPSFKTLYFGEANKSENSQHEIIMTLTIHGDKRYFLLCEMIAFDHEKNCLVHYNEDYETKLPKTENFDPQTHSLYQLSRRDFYMTKNEGGTSVHQQF